MDGKKCSKCLVVKPISAFYKNGRARGGFYAECVACVAEYRAKRTAGLADGSIPRTVIDKRSCTTCKRMLPVGQFLRKSVTLSGYGSLCKDCSRAIYLRREASLVNGTSPPKVSITEKLCSGCGKIKSAESFYSCKRSRTGLEHRCATCQKAEAHSRKLKKFGLTPEDYCEMLLSQGGVCAICGGVDKEKSLAVDHNHATGTVRGLLCSSCNLALGKFKDNAGLLRNAIEYLGRYERTPQLL